MINKKLILGAIATTFAATGWGLFISKQTNLPEQVLSKEDTPSESLPPQKPTTKSSVDFSRIVWELNLRDGQIDYKNQQIESLEQENTNLKNYLSELEKWADDSEDYMNELEGLLKFKDNIQ